jgi:hypothetical protein
MSYKPRNKARHKGGRDMNNPDMYEHWSDLYKVRERIKKLKEDLQRDCKAYWKYDALVEDIYDMQQLVLTKDKLMEYK